MKRQIWRVQPGEEAPDFDLPSTGDAAGKGGEPGRVRLSSFRGRQSVVLAFFPAAFTPVCSAQLPSYEEDLEEFRRRDAQLLALSTDPLPAIEAWARSLGGLSFPLLSDHWPHGHVSALYGVLRGDGRAERALFAVDRRGTVAYAHVNEIGSPPPLAPLWAALDRLR